MGYRSDICIAIDNEVKAWALIADNWPSLLNEADKTENDTDATFFWMEGWKWYESYSEVEEVMKFFTAIDKQFETKVAYAFVRIGEDPDDTEVHGGLATFGLELCRAIVRY